MAETFSASMDRATRYFRLCVEPSLCCLWPGARFVNIEAHEGTGVMHDFDVYAGIDAYGVEEEAVVGIASRIQPGKLWNTFTIRATRDTGTKTEYEKRRLAIASGTFFPKITVQTYVLDDGGEDYAMGIAKTVDIVDFIERFKPGVKHTGRDQHGQASFYVCGWRRMHDEGYSVVYLRKEPGASPKIWARGGWIADVKASKALLDLGAGGSASLTRLAL